MSKPHDLSESNLWPHLRTEAERETAAHPICARFLASGVLDRADFADALAHVLSHKLASDALPAPDLLTLFRTILKTNPDIATDAQRDLIVTLERDAATAACLQPLLFFKGFHALQTHRFAHALWLRGQKFPALLLQSLASERFAVDIHPAAQIGRGVMLDHATGIVVGETAVVGDNVSILHAVTLGGTGNEHEDRHPKIGAGVMIGAGAKILGNIKIGDCARIASGSVVLDPVPPAVTVAGVPARIVGKAGCAQPAETMDQRLKAET